MQFGELAQLPAARGVSLQAAGLQPEHEAAARTPLLAGVAPGVRVDTRQPSCSVASDGARRRTRTPQRARECSAYPAHPAVLTADGSAPSPPAAPMK